MSSTRISLEFRDGSKQLFSRPTCLTHCSKRHAFVLGQGPPGERARAKSRLARPAPSPVSNVQYKPIVAEISGASGGTYTYPAPANSGYSYIKLLEETGGADKNNHDRQRVPPTSPPHTHVGSSSSRLPACSEIGASTTNYRRDVVGAGSSLGSSTSPSAVKTPRRSTSTSLSGSGDCDGFAHDLVDPQTMVLHRDHHPQRWRCREAAGSGTFTFNALAGATAST